MSNSNLGVALTLCYFCNEGNEIVLNTRLTPRDAAGVARLHNKVLNMRPCPKCEALMKRGVILITIDDEKSGKDWNKPPAGTESEDRWMPNPYRTGGWFVVTDDAIKRMITDPDMQGWALKHRWMFIEHEAAKRVGLFDVEPVEKR